MSENGDKSRWVRISNLYKRHTDKGTSLQSQNLAKRLDDDWEDKAKEDKNYLHRGGPTNLHNRISGFPAPK